MLSHHRSSLSQGCLVSVHGLRRRRISRFSGQKGRAPCVKTTSTSASFSQAFMTSGVDVSTMVLPKERQGKQVCKFQRILFPPKVDDAVHRALSSMCWRPLRSRWPFRNCVVVDAVDRHGRQRLVDARLVCFDRKNKQDAECGLQSAAGTGQRAGSPYCVRQQAKDQQRHAASIPNNIIMTATILAFGSEHEYRTQRRTNGWAPDRVEQNADTELAPEPDRRKSAASENCV